MANSVAGAIDEAIGTSYMTRPIPRSVGAQARYLLAREKGDVAAAAARAGVTPRTFRGWTKSHALNQRISPLAGRKLRAAVTQEWQPGLRRKAEQQLATRTRGVTVETRASFGFRSAAGSTDDPRVRRITQRLDADVAQQLAAARAANLPEADLRDIVAAGLQHAYFQDGGSRAAGLVCELTDIDYLDLDFG